MFTADAKGGMRGIKSTAFHLVSFALALCLFFAGFVCAAGEESEGDASGGQPACGSRMGNRWDPAKYIGIDEIQPGMEAYCLTCFKGTEAERFDLKVISVVRNIEPGRDAILVQSTDERFVHTGPVAGCSGSPVYVNGRLAGALAFSWMFSKDPLFGVTPIREMLSVGQGSDSQQQAMSRGLAFDFSEPIDLSDVDRRIKSLLRQSYSLGGANPLPDLLVVSGLSPTVCQHLQELVGPLGLMPVAGGGSGGGPITETAKGQVQPGACLAVPWVTGDISMAWLGTVTEVVDSTVYGFGHGLLSYGPVDLPMATGQVYAVVSSMSQSFKLASTADVIGAVQYDQSAAVVGRIGAKARMIPLTVRVDRYNDTQPRVYNCQVADNRVLTPTALQLALAGAVLYLGELPLDHTVEYEVTIDIDDAESIKFKNVSTGQDLTEMLMDSVSSIMLLMNNPYKEVHIRSLKFDVGIKPKNVISHIWSVELSDVKVKAGQEIRIGVVVESFLAEKKKYEFSLKIPDQLRPGKYELAVCGSNGYEQFLRKAVPYRFVAPDMPGLIKALKDALSVERDRLYCLLVLPAGGLALQGAELPDLPGTKALIFQDARRALKGRPYPDWLEKSLKTGTVVIDREEMSIIVEK
jgi:hypothetical protein